MQPDPSQLRAHLEAVHGASFGWAMSCCARNREDARDVLQQAALRVLSGAAIFRGTSNFKTWFFGVVRVIALEHRRWKWLRTIVAPEPDPAPSPEQTLEVREEAAELIAALEKLSARQREVLHLVFYEELTIAEAAEVMRISLGSARTHYERGKQNLREQLKSRGAHVER